MTQEQVNHILTAICDEHDQKPDGSRPNIEIMHGPANGYTVIDATGTPRTRRHPALRNRQRHQLDRHREHPLYRSLKYYTL